MDAQAAEEAAHGGATSLPNPMHQFEIKRLIPLELFGFDASFTNSALFMVIAATLITLFTIYAMWGGKLVPTRLQSVAEISYEFIANMVRDNVGTSGMQYFPFIFTLFMFVLALNMLGMMPYSFTVTSHIIVTFALAAFIFLAVTAIGFLKHGIGFLKFFVPAGVPAVMLPLLVVIEVISYLTRPLSLSVRLFANMMAGHTMLKVFGAFVVALGLLGGWAPLAFMVGFTGLEILVAFLQAYVFAILTCIYLNDALHMHH
ncbi:MAG TPA: F0F1 ATP synthase subunit A [Methyloceanibacter sp.]|jgi:F-type H+-transporting ATPase subunit a